LTKILPAHTGGYSSTGSPRLAYAGPGSGHARINYCQDVIGDMRIRVLFFGVLKDLAGHSSESIDLPEHARLADVLSHYEERIPRMRDLVTSIAMSVNQEYAGVDAKLKSGDEVALLPAVSGGAVDSSGETPAAEPARGRRDVVVVGERIDTQ